MIGPDLEFLLCALQVMPPVFQALYLYCFNFVLKHIPDKSMGKVDSLSRQPDWQVGVDKDNKDRVLVKKEWLRRAEETLEEKDNLRNRIKEAQEKDK